VAAVAPGSTGWTSFAVSGTTVAYLAITLLTTPLQSAGEELIYRSVVLPAAASWVRAVRPALALGLVVSALGFAVVHASTDPWLSGRAAPRDATVPRSSAAEGRGTWSCRAVRVQPVRLHRKGSSSSAGRSHCARSAAAS
jgi:hypothetical protein